MRLGCLPVIALLALATTPAATPVPSLTPPTTPPATPAPSRAVLDGLEATWYCRVGASRCTRGYPPSCLCAAISPDLAYLRDRIVVVRYGSRSVLARIVDCLCSRQHGIDLYASVWLALGVPLSRGRITVSLPPLR